jgi:hypothetical protein
MPLWVWFVAMGLICYFLGAATVVVMVASLVSLIHDDYV